MIILALLLVLLICSFFKILAMSNSNCWLCMREKLFKLIIYERHLLCQRRSWIQQIPVSFLRIVTLIDEGYLSPFPNDNSLIKLLFMGIKNAEKKWTIPIWNWSLTISQLSIDTLLLYCTWWCYFLKIYNLAPTEVDFGL